MTQVRRTVSLSRELDVNLSFIARQRGESLSALLEMLLREHPLVDKEIQDGRLEDSFEDFGIRPRKGTRVHEMLTARSPPPSSSGAAPPTPRKKGAAHP
jgi:hypothetical protein